MKDFKISKVLNLMLTILFMFSLSNFFALAKNGMSKTNGNNKGKFHIQTYKKKIIENKNFFKKQQLLERKKKNDLKYLDYVNNHNESSSSKNFQHFNVIGFDLNVYKKGKKFILVYEHKLTKAKIIFNLITKYEMENDEFVDYYLFKVFDSSDSGIVHICEHCFFNAMDIREVIDKQSGDAFFKATTDTCSSSVVISSRSNTKEFMETMLSHLKYPLALRNEKLFQVEKNRVINEILDIPLSEHKTVMSRRKYDPGGIPEEIKKVTFKKFKNFYTKFIHPSNMIVFRNVDDLKPENIQEFLYTLDKYFLSYFTYEKIDVNYSLKNNSKFLKSRINLEVDENYLKTKNTPKNFANLCFDLKQLEINAKQKDVLLFNKKSCLLNYLKEYVKRLGYLYPENDDILELQQLQNELIIKLEGNDDLLFTESALCENSKKIFQFLKDQIKQLNENDLNTQYSMIINEPNDVIKTENGLQYSFNPSRYRNSSLYDFIKISFLNYDEIFSDKIFDINEDNEILEDKKTIFKNIKDNLNILDILKEKGPNYIDVLERNYKKVLYKDSNRQRGFGLYYLPFKLLFNDFALFKLSSDVFRHYLDYLINGELGLIYKIFRSTDCYEDFIIYAVGNNYSKSDVLNFIYSNFDILMQNLKIKSSFFQIYKRNYKNKVKKYLDELNKFKIKYQEFRSFLNYCLNNLNKPGFRLTIKDFFNVFNNNCSIGLDADFEYNEYNDFGLNRGNIIYKSLVFKNLKEKNNYKEMYLNFRNKCCDCNENVTKFFIESFLQNIYNPYCELLEFSFKKLGELYTKVDYITEEMIERNIFNIVLIDENELGKFKKVIY